MNIYKLDVKNKNTNLYGRFYILFIRNQRKTTKNWLLNKYRFRLFSSLLPLLICSYYAAEAWCFVFVLAWLSAAHSSRWKYPSSICLVISGIDLEMIVKLMFWGSSTKSSQQGLSGSRHAGAKSVKGSKLQGEALPPHSAGLRLCSAVNSKFVPLYLTRVARQRSFPSISPTCTAVPPKSFPYTPLQP
jgi:hypothetical protein